MRKTIEVVDGFYRDPMRRRELALGSEWVAATGDGPPTFDQRTRRSFPDEEATERIAALLALGGDRPLPTLSGHFTFVGDGGHERIAPHVHDTGWAAVVCLSWPDEFSTGIAFYRPATEHRALGAWGSAGVHEVRHPDRWEETMYVPLRFNRAVLFAASAVHHRAGWGFGREPRTGRVAQVFHFDEPTGDGEPCRAR